MGFWQNLVESYERNAEALNYKYPISTTTISNNSEMILSVVVDGEGNYIRVNKIDKYKKDKPGKDASKLEVICIPCSEKCMARSGSTIAPYPVFDQYEYLIGTGEKFEAYLSELGKFSESEFVTHQIKAIYKYVFKRTIQVDLAMFTPKPKTNIVFEVEIPNSPQSKVWEDESFFKAWNNYYLKQKENAKVLDYISGNMQPIAYSHPKKITNRSANAKLISDNDDKNYTFRGKFKSSIEALSIGYESSQKAHQFLRYLINDRGNYCGEQVILSFTIGSIENTLPLPLDNSINIFEFLQEVQAQTLSESQIALRAQTGFDYADALKKSINGFGYSKTLQQHTKTAVIALDAATTGRLSITFYREIERNEYLENVAEWHSSCKWHQRFWSDENKKYISCISAPSVDRIIEAVYGKPRGSSDESYTKIKKAARERLLRCIFDKTYLPKDYVIAAVRRASNPLGTTMNGKFDRTAFEQLLSTTCALIRKDHQQYIEEECKLSIELEKADRNYLYGRLLGAADKLEEYALFKKDNDRVVTAAIRHMQAFAQRPFRTWQTIHSCLNPYIQSVKGGFAFNEIQSIMQMFKTDDFGNDSSLDGLYLVGYYHERAYIDSLVKIASEKKQSNKSNVMEDSNVRN